MAGRVQVTMTDEWEVHASVCTKILLLTIEQGLKYLSTIFTHFLVYINLYDIFLETDERLQKLMGRD